MPKIHQVIATTGEYADRSSYPIMTYTRKSSATAHATAANKYAVEHDIHCPSYSTASGFPARKGDKIPGMFEREGIMDANPYHPGGRVDYTGISYHVVTRDIAGTMKEGLALLKPKVTS